MQSINQSFHSLSKLSFLLEKNFNILKQNWDKNILSSPFFLRTEYPCPEKNRNVRGRKRNSNIKDNDYYSGPFAPRILPSRFKSARDAQWFEALVDALVVQFVFATASRPGK